MNPKITENEVFLYHCNRLSQERRREVEDAVQIDPQVRAWFSEHAPANEPVAVPSIDLADPKMARIAAVAFEVVAREEEIELLNEWLLRPTLKAPVPELESNQLHTAGKKWIYRNEVPNYLGADPDSITIASIKCPWVEPDYRHGYLKVRQALDDLPDGRVDIVVVRLRGTEQPITYRLPGYQLKRTKSYWTDDITLRTIVPDGWAPGDTFYYAVEPAVTEGGK
jgi:hypothetical protein